MLMMPEPFIAWFLVKAYSQDGRIFIEIRTPASTLPDALRIATAHVDTQVRATPQGGPPCVIEARRL